MDKKNVINYHDFLGEIDVLHSKTVRNSADGIKFLSENNTDGITRKHTFS